MSYTKHPSRLCDTCNGKVNNGPSRPQISEPGSGRKASCPLCRLSCAAITFAASLGIDPLRSYTIDFRRLLYDHDITVMKAPASSVIQPSGITIQCCTEDFSRQELYTTFTTKRRERGVRSGGTVKADDYAPVTTSRPRRCISFQYRLSNNAVSPEDIQQSTLAILGHSPEQVFSYLLGVQPRDWSLTFDRLRHLMDSCQDHVYCRSNIMLCNSECASDAIEHVVRLVHCVTSTEGRKVRLEIFHGKGPPYVTLSHRWGLEQPWKTTTANIEHYLNDIPYTKLPRTIRDAFVVAEELGIQHLWVDSLSIVQDDEDDWRQQSRQMGLIYERSLCTLAAIDAFAEAKEDMGLLLVRDKIPAKVFIKSSFEFNYDSANGGDVGRNYTLNGKDVDPYTASEEAWDSVKKSSERTVTFGYTPFEMCVERSIWNTRGWIFQERLLSSRILYFTKEQVFWECAEGIQSEQPAEVVAYEDDKDKGDEEYSDTNRLSPSHHHLHRMLRVTNGRRATPLEDVYNPWKDQLRFYDIWDEVSQLQAWWPITERYTKCSLTFQKDRWYAIQGLCQILQTKYKSRIYAGVWDVGVGACLLWQAHSVPLTPIAAFMAPSWSWLRLSGSITYIYEDESYTGYIQEVAPLIQNHSFTGVDPLRSTRDTATEDETIPHGFSGSLTLTCPVRLAEVSCMQFKDFHFREQTGHATDPPAWGFFSHLTDSKAELEFAREYSTVKLPPMTRLLMVSNVDKEEDSQRAVGWVVLDQDIVPVGDVVCASIVLRVLHGWNDVEQHIIECIVLTAEDLHERGLGDLTGRCYQRIGRGRILEKGWLDTCETVTLSCV